VHDSRADVLRLQSMRCTLFCGIDHVRVVYILYKPPNFVKYLRTDRIGGLYASNSRPYSRIVRILSSKEYDCRMDVVEFEAITLLYSYASHEVCGILIH
jgi:hypothetical protein